MVTIKEIAAMANVSRTTVSRVLNESGYVSEEARSSVLEAIRKTGYVPSQQAKSLRTKQTKVIGVVLPKLSTETAGRIVGGINDVFREHGYQILLASTNLEAEKEIEYLRLLKSRQADGIILIATNIDPDLQEEINQLSVPFVAIGQEIPGVSTVTYDDYKAAETMTELLIQKGKSRIAFIGVDERDRSVGLLRKQGFLDTMKKWNLPVKKEWMAQADFTMESGFEAMKTIMAQASESNRPDAVFGVTDRLSIGAMQYLQQQGIAVPSQVAVAGIGGSELSEYVHPPLTTIDYENEQSGKAAAILLLEKLNQKNEQPKKITLPHRLIERSSL